MLLLIDLLHAFVLSLSNIYVIPTVWNHREFLNTMMLAELNDTYQIRYVYDMGPKLRGYAALMNDK